MKAIPIKIAPTFFLTAGIIGFINSFSLLGTLIWIGIIFVSVLVHELGHALTAKMFGQSVHIELVAFGGLTIPEGKKLSLPREFLVVFMGPFFGFMLFVFASLALLLPFEAPLLRGILDTFRFVNLFWTVINLLPILPLDGGQLVRICLEAFVGEKAWRATLYISLVVSAIFSFLFFLIGLFLIGAIFLIFTFQSFETLRHFQNYSMADRSEGNRNELKEIEALIETNNLDHAKNRLENLLEKTKKGVIHTVAKQYLAKIFYEKGESERVYELLKEDEKVLTKEGKCLLYLAAYDVGDFERVTNLSGVCFQELRTSDVALRAAASHAMLNQIHRCIQWLKTAHAFGHIDIEKVTQDHAFDAVREHEMFKKFVSSYAEK